MQTFYLDHILPNWRQGDLRVSGLRENILKFRQPGFSTIIEALLYAWSTTRRWYKSWIVAGDDSGCELLFEMVQRFFEHDKRRPKTRYCNRKELYFSDLDSVISVQSAGKVRLGRGTTINALHMSELAWWDKLDVRGGLLQAVPVSGNVFEETTANGFNEYEKLYQADKRAETNFRAWFFGWPMFREYSLPAPPGFKPSEEERHLAEVYHLTPEQLTWRREKKKELDATKTPFRQEYPINDREAFVSSGNPYFDVEALQARYDELQKPEYDPIAVTLSPTDYPRLRKALQRVADSPPALSEAELHFWELPRDEDWYIVSADPAGGIDTDGKRDYCSADVINVRTWEQVAHLHGRWEPFQFGLLLAELGWLYNEALLGVMSINHGHAVLDALLHTAKYPAQRGNGGSGVYFFDPTSITEKALQQDARQREAGWPENQRTKPWMLDKLDESLRIEPGLLVNARESLAELMSYVHLPGGKAGAEAGGHDDRVSSMALGAALLNLRFERRGRRGSDPLRPVEPVSLYGRTRER